MANYRGGKITKTTILGKSFLGMCLFLGAANYAFSEDGEIKLNSNDGSTKLIVQDKNAATVFSVDSDGNTVISGTAAIAGSGFSVGSSTLVVKDGNVGIGTTSPTAQLHVTGSVRFSGAGTPAAGKVLTSNVDGNASWQATAATPSGRVIMYSGSWNFDASGLGTGPLEGWALCNGSNGTLNLADRFVMVSTTLAGQGVTGGTNFYSLTVEQLPSHNHAVTDPGHNHGYVHTDTDSPSTGWGLNVSNTYIKSPGYGSISSAASNITLGLTGSGAAIDNRP
ncbi:MAG: hypothetical protein HY796_05765, partial [Elusimicrobia bacterium]|nr:hypothetical protein [Elusimicrobiota bacterium]